jgi:hypothetical protein
MAKRFLSPDEINAGRAFGLIQGWEVGGNIGTAPSEIRLFDAPIVNGLSAPKFRFREVSYSLVVPGTISGRRPSEKVISIRNGRVYATDARFIIYDAQKREGVHLPYGAIMSIEYRNGDFLITTDYHRIMKEIIMAQPKPHQPAWMSDAEYEQSVLTPIFLEAASHSIAGLLIHSEFPHSGLLEAITIIGAPSNLERLWYAGMLQQRNLGSNEFVSSFYYFLNTIADKNRFSQEIE